MLTCHEDISLIWPLKVVDWSASCSGHYRKAEAEIKICMQIWNLIMSTEDKYKGPEILHSLFQGTILILSWRSKPQNTNTNSQISG
jgi:hypothetical protein